MTERRARSLRPSSVGAILLIINVQSRQLFLKILPESLKSQTSSDPTASSSSAADKESSEEISEAKALEIANTLLEEQSAYDRFAEDISAEEDDHLDFPLVDEERLLIEYISVLGM